MPQNPIVPRPGGSQSRLDITAATVVKATPGTLYTISVTTPGVVGAAYDADTVAGNTAANLIAVIPAAEGQQVLTWPCSKGILIVPGAGQVVSISFA